MAKTKVSTLHIAIEADSKGLRQGLSKAGTTMRGFSAKASTALKAVGAAMAGIAAAAAVVAAAFWGVVKAVQAVVKVAKELEDVQLVAKRLGLATDELIALRRVADQAGSSAGTLDMALQRMTRRVAEAAMGTGEAVKALKELRLSAADLNSMTAGKRFEEVAKALSRVRGESDRVRLAMKLFDSEGVALLETLGIISEKGLAGVTAEAKELGLTFSGLDTQNLELLSKASNELSDSWKGMKNELLAAFGPAAIQAIELTTAAVIRLGDALKPVRDFLKGITAEDAKALEAVIAGGSKITRLFGEELAKVAEAIPKAFDPAALKAFQDQLASVLESAKTPMQKLQEEILKVGQVWDAIPFAMRGNVLNGLVDKMTKLKDGAKAIGKAVSFRPTAANDITSQAGISQMNEALRNSREGADDATKKAEELERERIERDKARDEILKSIDKTMRKVGEKPPIEVKSVAIVG